MREAQGNATIELITEVIARYPDISGRNQSGEASFYPRRTPKDSELDINKSIEEQFNLLRIVDNNYYPAFFIRKGTKYILKIEKG